MPAPGTCLIPSALPAPYTGTLIPTSRLRLDLISSSSLCWPFLVWERASYVTPQHPIISSPQWNVLFPPFYSTWLWQWTKAVDYSSWYLQGLTQSQAHCGQILVQWMSSWSVPWNLFLLPLFLHLPLLLFYSIPAVPWSSILPCSCNPPAQKFLALTRIAYSNYQTRTPGNYTCLEIASMQQMSKWLLTNNFDLTRELSIPFSPITNTEYWLFNILRTSLHKAL